MNITINFYFFIETLIAHKEKSVIDSTLAALIKETDPEETLVHVEPYDHDPNLFAVWRIKEWRASVIRYEQVKEREERERQANYILKEKTRRLTAAILKGMPMDNSLANMMASSIIATNNKAFASVYGIDLDKLFEGI